jgi:hypothetical protein
MQVQKKVFLKSLPIMLFTSAFTGLLWGIMRIELVLLVPFFFLVVYLFDAAIYTIYGYWIGKRLGSLTENRIWIPLLSPILMYGADRFLSAIIILGIPYSGRISPPWRFLVEIVIISLAFLATWRGWLLIQREAGKS